MADTPLWLGVVGAASGVVSFGWNLVAFQRQGPRAHLQLVYGGVYGNHGVIASRDLHERTEIVDGLRQMQADPNCERVVAGLRVTNPGRAALFIAGVSTPTVPGTIRGHDAHLECEGSPPMPCEIPAGGEMTFYIPIATLNGHIASAEYITGRPQRICFEIWNAHRDYRTEPIPPEHLGTVPPDPRPIQPPH